jgi:hypothetical protein
VVVIASVVRRFIVFSFDLKQRKSSDAKPKANEKPRHRVGGRGHAGASIVGTATRQKHSRYESSRLRFVSLFLPDLGRSVCRYHSANAHELSQHATKTLKLGSLEKILARAHEEFDSTQATATSRLLEGGRL